MLDFAPGHMRDGLTALMVMAGLGMEMETRLLGHPQTSRV